VTGPDDTTDQRAAARAQRARARRALAEAGAAVQRLREAKARVERLLQASGTRLDDPSITSLRSRMQHIESRMQATEVMMRSAEDHLSALSPPTDDSAPLEER